MPKACPDAGKGRAMLRDFASIAAFFSEREIDELQAAIDARREARMRHAEDPAPRRPSLGRSPGG